MHSIYKYFFYSENSQRKTTVTFVPRYFWLFDIFKCGIILNRSDKLTELLGGPLLTKDLCCLRRECFEWTDLEMVYSMLMSMSKRHLAPGTEKANEISYLEMPALKWIQLKWKKLYADNEINHITVLNHPKGSIFNHASWTNKNYTVMGASQNFFCIKNAKRLLVWPNISYVFLRNSYCRFINPTDSS